MWIMSKLNYYSKMFWLLFIAASITLSTTYLYIERLNADIDSAKNKIEALKIAQHISESIEVIQTYRGISTVCMYNECHENKVFMYEEMVYESLIKLQKSLSAYDVSQIPIILSHFKKAKKSSVEHDFTTFIENVAPMLRLLEQLKYSSTLKLGINNESSQQIYTLMQNSLFASQKMLEQIALSSTYCARVLARKELDEKTFSFLKESVSTSQFLFKHLFETAEYYEGLSVDKNSIQKSFSNYIEVLEAEVFSQKLRYAPDAFLYDASLFLKHIRRFQSDSIDSLKIYYASEYEKYLFEKNTILMLLLVGSLIWFYFFLGYYFVLKRSIKSIEVITNDVSKGELHKRIEDNTQDEFKIIVKLINSMITSLENENRMLCEYKKALDASAPICRTDNEGRIIYVNEAYERLTKYTYNELIGNTHAMLRSPNSSDVIYQQLWEDITAKNIHHTTFENVDKFGNQFFVQCTIVPVINQHSQITEFIAIMNDITEIELKKSALKFKLLHDSLTDLPNRVALKREMKKRSNVKLMLLNIDRFSDINSIYGEVVADELLKQIGEDVSSLLDTTRLSLFKLSADEYAILAEESVTESNFQEDVIMLSHFLNPIKLTNTLHEIGVRISIGAVIAKENEMSRPILSMAKEALQNAKQNPRAYQFYQHSMQAAQKVENNIKMLEHLEYAIENKKVRAHFQPIYSLKEKKITKFETLIRIEDSYSNILYPKDFMDIAKHSRLYATLTKHIVAEAVQKAIDNPAYNFSINISYEDMIDASTVATIIDILESSQVAHKIIFEMLESVEIEENLHVENFIRQVKELGSLIAIDDFGSGYSNYAYLMKAGVDIVKIDGSLISLIDRDENVKKIVDSIISIAQDLEIETVAEYVSSRSIYDTLVESKIDNVQGSYIGTASAELINEREL